MNLSQHLLLRLLIAISVFSIAVSALDCIQCAPNSAWYSEQEEERRIEACRQGLVAPTKCSNATHTHCIVNWYRTGGSSEKIVTKRHCGMESDVTGCTLYNSKISRKVRRHLLGRDDSHDRKESVASFVEVCSTSCPVGECVNSSNIRKALLFPTVISAIYTISLYNTFF